jgi:hypothetical protein
MDCSSESILCDARPTGSELATGLWRYEELGDYALKTSDVPKRQLDGPRHQTESECYLAIDFAETVPGFGSAIVITPVPLTASGWSQPEYPEHRPDVTLESS